MFEALGITIILIIWQVFGEIVLYVTTFAVSWLAIIISALVIALVVRTITQMVDNTP